MYMSSNADVEELLGVLRLLICQDKSYVIGGDFNLDLIKKRSNSLTSFLTSQGFKQLVTKATHIQGGLIDHCYARIINECSYEIDAIGKVYSDHDSLCFTLKFK